MTVERTALPTRSPEPVPNPGALPAPAVVYAGGLSPRPAPVDASPPAASPAPSGSDDGNSIAFSSSPIVRPKVYVSKHARMAVNQRPSHTPSCHASDDEVTPPLSASPLFLSYNLHFLFLFQPNRRIVSISRVSTRTTLRCPEQRTLGSTTSPGRVRHRLPPPFRLLARRPSSLNPRRLPKKFGWRRKTANFAKRPLSSRALVTGFRFLLSPSSFRCPPRFRMQFPRPRRLSPWSS